MTNKPFRQKTEHAIRQAIKLRLLLIETNKTKNNITHNQCKQVVEEINVLRSDKQFAKYLTKNFYLIERMMPGPHKKSKVILNQLHEEASKYL